MTASVSRILEAVAVHGSVETAAAALETEPAAVVLALKEAARRLNTEPASPAQRSLFDAPPRAPVSPAASQQVQTSAIGRLSHLVLHSDGAARSNPGPAGAGAVLSEPGGKIVGRFGRFLGSQTNNVAEYEGVILGLEKAAELGVRQLDVRADSMLVIKQLRGEWKVKHPGLVPYFEKAKGLLRRFERVTLEHVRRELNVEADEMSNRAIDEKM